MSWRAVFVVAVGQRPHPRRLSGAAGDRKMRTKGRRQTARTFNSSRSKVVGWFNVSIWTSQGLKEGPSEIRPLNRARINVTSYPVPYTQVLRVPPGKQISIARRFADDG